MPLFEVANEELVPFRTVRGGADLYEKEIEDLLWGNLEEFTGEALFPVARQPNISGGGRPDVVALDEDARVVVIEVKREVDRSQLAQCLEYAGWARTTSLDELAGLYHRGPDEFFADWQDFTDSTTPAVVNPAPRLLLVARDSDGRTRSAIGFLEENGLPITVIPVLVYEDEAKRRFLDIGADYEPAPPSTAAAAEVAARAMYQFRGRRVLLSDLLDHGLLQPGDRLVWRRPRLGEAYEAKVLDTGEIRLDKDGSTHKTPSVAAMEAAGIVSYDGWHAWRVTRLDGALLDDLRQQLIASEALGDGELVAEGSAPGESDSGVEKTAAYERSDDSPIVPDGAEE